MSDNSEKIIEIISAYLDGEVTEEEKAEVENLLQINQEAVAVYEQLSSARNLLNKFENVEAPQGFKSKVIKTISLSRKRSFFKRLSDMVAERKIKMPILSYTGAIVVITFILASYYLAAGPMFIQEPETEGEEFVFVDELQQPGEKTEDQAPGLLAEAPSREELQQEEFAETAPEEGEAIDEAEADDQLMTDSGKVEHETETRPEPAMKEEETLLAQKSFAESESRERAASPMARPDRQRSEMNYPATGESKKTVSPPALKPVFDNPLYRAEIIQAFPTVREDSRVQAKRAKGKLEEFIIESGNRVAINTSAEYGSDQNPVSAIDQLSVPLPEILFASFGPQSDHGSVLVYGEMHVGRDGTIRYFRLTGHEKGRLQIESYARYLRSSRIMPAIHNSKNVSVIYSFIATISKYRQMTD